MLEGAVNAGPLNWDLKAMPPATLAAVDGMAGNGHVLV